MSVPINTFSNIQRVGGQTIGNDDFFETRIENDSAGNPIFVGTSPIANADPADKVWYIRKMGYDGNTFLNRVQQPDGGFSYTYAWDDRATYF